MITKESQLIFSEIFIGNLLNVYFDDNQTPVNNFLRGNACLSQPSILIKLLEQKEFVFVVSLVKLQIKKDVPKLTWVGSRWLHNLEIADPTNPAGGF